MAKAPSEAYSEINRELEGKLHVYFDGPEQEPITIDKNNYLVSMEILEEAMTSSNTPWGNVSANELSITLHNEGDIFNPYNASSILYGKIQSGIKVECFIRPTSAEDYDWDPLGIFYVIDWVTTAGGMTVDVICYDRVKDVLGSQQVKMPVIRNISEKDFIQSFFDLLGVPVVVDDALTQILPLGYILKENKDVLNDFIAGMCVFIFCDHAGEIKVQSMRKKLTTSHTITDDDQIVDIKAQQGVSLDYDGVQIILRTPQLSDSIEILNMKDTKVPVGGISFQACLFSSTPVAQIELGHSSRTGWGRFKISRASSVDVDFSIENLTEVDFVDTISLWGRVVETAGTEWATEGANLLKHDSIYCQTEERFESLKTFLTSFVRASLPLVEVVVRGNPQFEIGQKILVASTRFNVWFEGVLIRQKLRFDGGMSSDLTIMSSKILEVT